MRKHPAIGMKAGELGELYTYLKLFGQVYTDCETERQILEQEIEEIFEQEYSGRDASRTMQAMRNSRKEGGEKTGQRPRNRSMPYPNRERPYGRYPLKPVFLRVLCRG